MIDFVNSDLIVKQSALEAGIVKWKSPSNIAIVKYWGKYGSQMAQNPSISFTLSAAHSETSIEYIPKKTTQGGDSLELEFYFEGKPKPEFEKRVSKFLKSVLPVFPFLVQFKLIINSKNSFPHSSGIASSASSMSALVLCLCGMERKFFGTLPKEASFLTKASFVSRLASGSACRSVCPFIGVWGASEKLKGSSDFFAIPFLEGVDPVFMSFHDDILIVNSGTKHVSSSAGHALMDGNVYANARFRQARERVDSLIDVLKQGDLQVFGEILESEALTLHALMMASKPAYMLLRPNTIEIINRVWAFRRSTDIPLYFTLDAGPNIHLLYPDSFRESIGDFIATDLLNLCENRTMLCDVVGKGPSELA